MVSGFGSFIAALFNVSGPDFAFIGIIGAIQLACLAFWIWMIIDCAQNEKETNLIVWILILIFVPLGTLIYYFVRKLPRG